MQQVSGLIFKELIKRGYSLEGKTRVWNIADSKLWYLTPEQSQGFLDLENSVEYRKKVIQQEIDLIKNNANSFLGQLRNTPINIIELGCGDGKKAVIFIEKLKKEVKLRYCPIDISSYMVKKAIDKVRKMNVGEVVEFQWNISDFENLENISEVLRKDEFKTNLFLLLGNTLGNFEINELLYGIKEGMVIGDFLLIGNGLDNRNRRDILKSYDTKEINNWLIKIVEGIGLNEEDVKFESVFNNSRVEGYYIIKKDFKVSFQGKEINFINGDRILVFISYKYNDWDFRSFIKMYFSNTEFFISKDNSYALAFCKK